MSACFAKRVKAYVEQAWSAHETGQHFQFRDPVSAAKG